MLRKITIQIYSHLFHTISRFHLAPFNWDAEKLHLYVPKHKLRTKWAWPFVVLYQNWHFSYLMWKLYLSFIAGETVPFLLFQVLWNVIFLIPVLAQLNFIFRAKEIANTVTIWFKLESRIEIFPPKALMAFLTMFTPIAILHFVSYGSLYIENPKRPQFLFTLWHNNNNNKDDQQPNPYAKFIFAILEFTANFANWQLVLFFTFLCIGFTNSLNAWVNYSWRNVKSAKKAYCWYKRCQRFAKKVNHALFIAIPGTKIILMFCMVFSVFNMTRRNHGLPLIPYLLMPFTAAAGVVFFMCCYPPMGELYESSLRCLTFWKYNLRILHKNSTVYKYGNKDWNALTPIGIQVERFYIVKKSSVVMFFSIMFYYVITLTTEQSLKHVGYAQEEEVLLEQLPSFDV